MCVACGERPQPARKDSGDHPTHHRCEECWRVYQGRRNLRDRILKRDGWSLGFERRDRHCSLCGMAIPPLHFAIKAEEAFCLSCVEACGFYEAMQRRKAHLPPRLNHAKVMTVPWELGATPDDLQIPVDKRRDFVYLSFPLAMPVMLGLAIHVVRVLMERKIQSVAGPHRDAMCFRIHVRANRPGRAERLAAIATEAVLPYCACVEVPRACYGTVRGAIYDTFGNPLVRRVKRATVQ